MARLGVGSDGVDGLSWFPSLLRGFVATSPQQLCSEHNAGPKCCMDLIINSMPVRLAGPQKSERTP